MMMQDWEILYLQHREQKEERRIKSAKVGKLIKSINVS